MSRPPMNTQNGAGGFDRDERDLELLAAYALGALDPAEEREIDRLLAAIDDVEVESFERAAAATLVANLAPAIEPMPGALRSDLKRFGRQWAATNLPERGRQVASSTGQARAGVMTRESSDEPSTFRFVGLAGWLAAAACLALAAVAWMPLASSVRSSGPIVIDDGWLRAEPGMSQQQLAQVRNALFVRPGDAVLASWTPTETPDPTAAGAGGDVVWSTDEQCGVMRIVGLEANDPNAEQYQLWIFDEDQQHPIDGGVFDIPASGEVLVPITAKLRVRKPTLFAITVEKPGGVVVSDRSRIALLGASLEPASEAAGDSGKETPGREE